MLVLTIKPQTLFFFFGEALFSKNLSFFLQKQVKFICGDNSSNSDNKACLPLRNNNLEVALQTLDERRMEQPSLRSTKRASSESSLIRLRRRDKLPLTKAYDFPSVENAVKHFKRKLDGEGLVAVSVPLNHRSSFLDIGDEHRLKYHHRSVDEIEKMSYNSERLRTVLDEEIDLDYIDIVYEANKPTKQRYMSLSCAPPIKPNYFPRTIKLQQRSDSRESRGRGRDDNEAMLNSFQGECSNETKMKSEHVSRRGLDALGLYKNNTPLSSSMTKLIETRGSDRSFRSEHIPDHPNKAHRLSYLRKTNGIIGAVNRANTREMQRVLRYSKYVNEAFRVNGNNV